MNMRYRLPSIVLLTHIIAVHSLHAEQFGYLSLSELVADGNKVVEHKAVTAATVTAKVPNAVYAKIHTKQGCFIMHPRGDSK